MALGKKTGGRVKGSGNKKPPKEVRMARVERDAEQGLVEPLDIMLDNARTAYNKALEVERAIIPAMISGLPLDQAFTAIRREVDRSLNLRREAQECAKDAAPYCHPKLNATVHSGKLTLEMLVQASYGITPPPPPDPQVNGKSPPLIEAKPNGRQKTNGS